MNSPATAFLLCLPQSWTPWGCRRVLQFQSTGSAVATSRGSWGFSQSSSAGLTDIRCFQPKQTWWCCDRLRLLGSDGKEGCACWVDNSPTSATYGWSGWKGKECICSYLNPLQCSCLENLRDGGAWWAAVCEVTQSRTRLK